MAQKPKISIVIPSRDEAPTIAEIIRGVQSYADEMLVVDGHSKDHTREIAQREGARVILDHGKGKGEALRLAIQEVTGDIIVFIDADGSHDVQDIPRLLKPIIEDDVDMVIGSRMRGGSDELHGEFLELVRLWGSGVITLCINWRFGKHLTDYQNGLRAIKTDVARKLTLQENHTTIEQEMSIECLKRKFRVEEVPTHEYRRRFGKSKISLLRHGPRYVYTLIKKLIF